MKTERALTIITTALAAIIAVATAGGDYDLMDTAIGLILAMLLWPTLKSIPIDKNERTVIAGIAGLCGLLISGVLLDLSKEWFVVNHIFKIKMVELQLPHLLFWFLLSLVAFGLMRKQAA